YAVKKKCQSNLPPGSCDYLHSRDKRRAGRQNFASCRGQVLDDDVGAALRIPLPLRFVAVVDEHRAAAGPIPRFDIVEDVADEPAFVDVEIQLAGRLKQHARLGLAATA